jgi:predicted nucleic acid-binding protein
VKTDGPEAVLDAGPLIHLDELGCLDLLADLSPLVAPDVVWEEARIHRDALQLGQVRGLRIVPSASGISARLGVLVDTLGLAGGETAALAVAERRICRMFLTDDSAARFASESLGIRVHGTLGVLLRSIRRGLRSRADVLAILSGIRERSTLHVSQGLLNEIMARVTAE